MTRNDRNAANAPVPAWLGWKRNISYAALATLVSAVFIYQLTRPHSLLGGMLGWELERIDDASREGAAATPGSITWAGLFAQLERKMPTLPDARPRAGTAQLIYAVDAVQRGRLSAVDAVARLAPAEDAATFNLVARLAYGWISDRAKVSAATSPDSSSPPTESSSPATPNSPSNTSQPSISSALPTSSASLARYDSLSRILDAQPPATTATLYNDTLHDAWRDVLQTIIRRQDVIASCVRNYRHFDIREHYAALPTIHATFTSLARELRTAGHAPQAETIRQWLDRAYMGLIDTERDYATRLLAAELLTDTRAADFYTAAPNHHRPSKLREAFHEQAAEVRSNLLDLLKAPAVDSEHIRRDYFLFSLSVSLFAAWTGLIVAFILRFLIVAIPAGRVRQTSTDPSGLKQIQPGISQLWLGPVGFCGSIGGLCAISSYAAGEGGAAEGYAIRLAASAAAVAILALLSAASLADASKHRSAGGVIAGCCALLLAFFVVAGPERRLWPILRVVDIGVGSGLTAAGILLLMICVAAVCVVAPLRINAASIARALLVCAVLSMATTTISFVVDRRLLTDAVGANRDETTARLGLNWKSSLPPVIKYETSADAIKN